MLRARIQSVGRAGALLLLVLAGPVRAWTPADLFKACDDDCAVAVYGGSYVKNSMGQVLVEEPETPFTWTYLDDYLIATAISRRAGTLWGHVDLEPEIGIGQRFGIQDETEVWAALYFRYRGFPWDKYLTTSIAISTGLNYATGVSEVEKARAKDGEGSRLMHFFSPEITFALPSAPNSELLFRFHHRSGVFGIVSDAFGGAQYGTVGFRVRF
jgi:hypothetical protein